MKLHSSYIRIAKYHHWNIGNLEINWSFGRIGNIKNFEFEIRNRRDRT